MPSVDTVIYKLVADGAMVIPSRPTSVSGAVYFTRHDIYLFIEQR
jgi:hypothetical protein